MDKNKRWAIGFSLLLFSILVIMELVKPETIDWSYDFRGNSKKPNGCFVYLKCLKNLLNEKNIRENTVSILDFLKEDSLRYNDLLLYITDDFSADSVEVGELISSVNAGRSVFVSALSFSSSIKDTLNFQISSEGLFNTMHRASFKLKYTEDSSVMYHFKGIRHSSFSEVDSSRACILGTDSVGHANFISIGMGKGTVYLHLAPEVFSNNQILYGNRDYALALSSLFTGKKLGWDDYLKPGNLYKNGAPTPLRFILSDPYLETAYILLLVTLLLLIILGSKRRQKIIPLFTRPANASLEFVSIISGLYLGSSDNLKMAEKKFTFFCDYIRTHYFLSAITENEEFYSWLAEKSGVHKEDIKDIFDTVSILRKKQKIHGEELIHFVKSIDEFYDKAEGKNSN